MIGLINTEEMTNVHTLWLRNFTFKNLHHRFTGVWLGTELFIAGKRCETTKMSINNRGTAKQMMPFWETMYL